MHAWNLEVANRKATGRIDRETLLDIVTALKVIEWWWGKYEQKSAKKQSAYRFKLSDAKRKVITLETQLAYYRGTAARRAEVQDDDDETEDRVAQAEALAIATARLKKAATKRGAKSARKD